MSVAEIVLSEEVASRLRSAARVRGVTVEAFITESLDMRLAAERQVAYLDERAARSDVQSAITLVRNAPDVPPEDGDEVPDASQIRGTGR
jgi:hypothetical protein